MIEMIGNVLYTTPNWISTVIDNTDHHNTDTGTCTIMYNDVINSVQCVCVYLLRKCSRQ